MAKHISLRLAWHEDGWNGHVCKKPKANTYCVGQHSYPGSLINDARDLDWETKEDVAGCHCSTLDGIPPCSYSINAFGAKPVKGESKPPDFFKDNSEGVTFDIPESTACIWPYEQMYSDDVKRPPGSKQYYNYDKRLENGKQFFNQLEPDSSIIFYYANKSNPFSEEDNRNYVLVGVSRLKKTGDIMYYKNVSETNRNKYANGFVWQVPVTSHYPDEGFAIPYHKFKDNPEVLNKILYIPEIPNNFKYGTRHISDDDALIYVERLTEIVDYLKDVDSSENWETRKAWLLSLQNELWRNRGPYPGLFSVLEYLEMSEFMVYYKDQVIKGEGIHAKNEIFRFLKDKTLEDFPADNISNENLKKYQKQWFVKLETTDKKILAENVLSKIDLKTDQVKNIINDKREENNIYSSVQEIIKNPFLISEEYVGDNIDDQINFEKIDHAMLPSPQLDIEVKIAKDDTRRLRALMVENLKKIDVHSFMDMETVLNSLNRKLANYPDWKSEDFNKGYVDFDKELFEKKIVFRNKENIEYLYLKDVYIQERLIERQIRNLINRQKVDSKRPYSREKWKNSMYQAGCELDQKAPEDYLEAVEGQIEVCQQIFLNPVSVLSGAAGTGKTNVIKAIIQAIKTTSNNTEKFLLLAPTGKASDRMRESTGEDAKTIHQFLASNGWLNPNFIFKKEGGKKETDITTYIIDETSMIDLSLMATLFKAINWDYAKRIMFVGDPNQLPPIGKGKVFSDIIKFIQEVDKDAYGHLKKNIRQMENRIDGKGTGILDIASVYAQNNEADSNKSDFEEILNRLNEDGELDKDVKVSLWENDEMLEENLIQQIKDDMESSGNTDIMDYQVISPYRGELYGTEHLNKVLQITLNGKNLEKGTLGGIAYFDKVIQFSNRANSKAYWAYDLEKQKKIRLNVFNGEIGKTWAKNINYGKVKFNTTFTRHPDTSVGFSSDSEVEENIELGYAISVHKSQGSEFNYLYLVIPQSKQGLLSTELIYTGITRAKTQLRIFVEKDLSILQSLRRPERSKLNFINSSLFEFEPLPLEFSNMGSWYEEGKIHKTLTEYMVRSKSEVIITNLIVANEIESFSYETLLYAPDKTFYLPDFTIHVNGKTYFWEHVGMLHVPKYKQRWEQKESWYKKHFPGQMIATYESGNLTLDAQQLIDQLKQN